MKRQLTVTCSPLILLSVSLFIRRFPERKINVLVLEILSYDFSCETLDTQAEQNRGLFI